MAITIGYTHYCCFIHIILIICWFRSLVGSARNNGWHENRAQKRTIRGQQTYVLVQEMLLQHIKTMKITIMKHHEQLMKSHINPT